MYHCDLTLPSPQENLACDEILLDLCEQDQADELLRFWEPTEYFVVVGYGNKVETEVNVPFCQENLIPVLRRCSGGGTVLQGPGVLNYSLILRSQDSPHLQSIRATNEFILQRIQKELASPLKAPVESCGCTDLAIGGLKFCGNAQRRKKNHLLFHGSFLLHLDVDLVEKALPQPSKQPDYRLNRSHSDFLMNLKVPPAMLKSALQRAWDAPAPFKEIPFDEIYELAESKYGRHDWNFKF